MPSNPESSSHCSFCGFSLPFPASPSKPPGADQPQRGSRHPSPGDPTRPPGSLASRSEVLCLCVYVCMCVCVSLCVCVCVCVEILSPTKLYPMSFNATIKQVFGLSLHSNTRMQRRNPVSIAGCPTKRALPRLILGLINPAYLQRIHYPFPDDGQP